MRLDRRAFIGGGAVLTVATQAAAATNVAGGGGPAQRRALDQLSHYVEQHRTDWGLPGMSVCVVDRDGYSGFIRSGWANVERREPIREDHIFQIGSITKMMVALTAWSMIQEGRLSPDAKLTQLMPELSVAGGGDINLQHLLNHTTGMPDNAPMFPEGGLWSGYAPGSHWSYCNLGYEIIGHIIARRDGRSLQDALEARLLRPLGMTQTRPAIRVGDRPRYPEGYEPQFNDRAMLRPAPMTPAPWIDSDAGAGCVASTTHDMAIFARFLIGLAQGRGGPVLSDPAAAQFIAVSTPGWDAGAAYGNGIARITKDGRRYLHHTGGMVSFSSAIHVDTEAGIAAFASSNVGGGLNYRPRDVTLYACQLFRTARDGGEAPTPKPTRPSVEHVERYVGVFTAASGDRFEVRATGDQTKLRYNGRETDMQFAGGGFACVEPAFAVSGLVFEMENDHAIRAWANDVEYIADPEHGYKPPASAELRALAGRYDNDDRWWGPATVIARDGRLWLGNTDALTPLGDGSWRMGDDEWSPERIRFDGVIDGRPTRMLLSGLPFVRRFS
ncbi:MAG: serine hydrolase [Proteobacteria bacterium]|nr:serine hydrolase [Pseudomonadota bacterium]